MIFNIKIFNIILLIHFFIKILSENHYFIINHISHFLGSKFIPFFFLDKLLRSKYFNIILFLNFEKNIILTDFIIVLVNIIHLCRLIELGGLFINFLAILIIIIVLLFINLILLFSSVYAFKFFP